MIDIDSNIVNFIRSNSILTLATADIKTNEPWVCTLYYGTDENLNMFVVTDPESTHILHAKSNPNVAFNIYDSHTKITESKKGVQGKGSIYLVKNPVELLKGLNLWHKTNPGIESKITIKDLKKVKDTKLFRIEPHFLKFFNKDLYGSKEYGEAHL